jgi:hypothetical protein
MSPGTEKHQSFKGYDDDFVIGCTLKTREEHGIGLIYTHFGHNAKIGTSAHPCLELTDPNICALLLLGQGALAREKRF